MSDSMSETTGYFLALLLVATFEASAIADESQYPQAAAASQRTIDTLRSYAARHSVIASDGSGQAFELRSVPLLAWTNPTRGDVSGGLFLWVEDERPIASGGIFLWLNEPSKELGREFHSLTTESLVAEFDGRQFWTFGRPGIEYQSLSAAGPAGHTRSIRLRQIKQSATRFDVRISDRDAAPELARLLPTPVYRYADSDSGVIDGAVFAFVQGNDPEALLLIEIHSTGTGELAWRYSLARCTTWAVDVELDGKPVYHVPRYDYRRIDRAAAFFSAPRMQIE
jgi:hypothetical protein